MLLHQRKARSKDMTFSILNRDTSEKAAKGFFIFSFIEQFEIDNVP